MKRRVILAICIIVLAIIGYVSFSPRLRYDVTITQSQIDAALRKHFPVSKNYYRIFRVTYSNPRVTLLPNTSRIEVGLDVELEIDLLVKSMKLGSGAIATSGIIYRNDTHQFFLSDPRIDKLTFQWVPQVGVDAVGDLARKSADKLNSYGISTEQITRVTESATALAIERLQQYPVYTLHAKDAKSAAAMTMVKDVEVRGNELHVTLGR